MIDAIHQAVAHFQYLAFLRREIIQDLAHLLRENAFGRLLHRRRDPVVGDEVAERRFLVVVRTDRVLERERILIDLLYLIDLLRLDTHLYRYLLCLRVAAECLRQAP